MPSARPVNSPSPADTGPKSLCLATRGDLSAYHLPATKERASQDKAHDDGDEHAADGSEGLSALGALARAVIELGFAGWAGFHG